MREIKFRAWDRTRQKMDVVWNLNWLTNSKAKGVAKGSVSHVHTKRDFKGTSLTAPEQDSYYGGVATNYIIMQYIGLQDKNGIEVYEGDIVKMGRGAIKEIKYSVRQGKSDFVTSLSGFYYHWDGDNIAQIDNIHRVEVIGNIYENPDLIIKDTKGE